MASLPDPLDFTMAQLSPPACENAEKKHMSRNRREIKFFFIVVYIPYQYIHSFFDFSYAVLRSLPVAATHFFIRVHGYRIISQMLLVFYSSVSGSRILPPQKKSHEKKALFSAR